MDEKETYDLKALQVPPRKKPQKEDDRQDFSDKQARKVRKRIAQIRRDVEALNDRLYETLDLLKMLE